MPGKPPSGVTDAAEAHPISVPFAAHWYAVWVMSNAEFAVADTLEDHGFEPFVPVYQEVSQWSDRKKLIDRPLFPGYLFVRASDQLRDIPRIAGVIELLPNNINPIPIDDDQIAVVRRVLESRLPVAPAKYLTGEEVLIDRGPLAGVKGIVQRTKQGTRVIVRIEMLQRAVSVEVDADDVKAAA